MGRFVNSNENMEVKRFNEFYPDWDRSIDWSSFSYTAQSNYTFARIALQSTGPSMAVTLSHQMVELYIKAFVLYSVCESNYSKYEPIRRKYSHNTDALLEAYKNDVPAFKAILESEKNVNFIRNISRCYIDARFGQTYICVEADDCEILDNIFRIFTTYMYKITKVHSLLYLTIPSGTERFFLQSTILDFTQDNCGDSGRMIGNIKILIDEIVD
jgi:HEPN domain-containing protein